jgi:16S rRNA processing protein RimM
MSRHVVVGEILGAFGVRGWVKVHSYTQPPENILKYSPWLIGANGNAEECKVIEGRRHGNTVVACLESITDRDRAALLRGSAISVPRDRFPPPKPGEFYWTDLVGLEVRTTAGVVLGKVANMMETGANDVMNVHGDRERLIPFVMGEFVKEVRLDEGILIVDWDPDF